MFKNYIKIAWRNLIKNKGYSAINVGGLAIGMAVVILIGLWVIDELSYNKYHKNYDRIAQIYERATDPDSGEIEEGNSMMYITGTLLKENYKDHFKHILRANWVGDYTVGSEGEVSTQTGLFIENGALEMFSLEMVHGSYSSLEELNAMVLSASAAKAIFGSVDPIGKTLKINNQMEAVVKGVYKDLPKNTRFQEVQFLANWELYEMSETQWFSGIRNMWDEYSFNLYVALKPESDFKSADTALDQFFEDYAPESFARLDKYHPKLFMYPMEQWHLYSQFEQGYATGGRITFVWLFIGIGLFVLLLACINFMNLSTARSEKRAKEVGIRKTVGSRKNQLIFQFLSESILVSILALALSLILVMVSLPWFNGLANKDMGIPWSNILFWITIISFTLFTGVLAGSYPALYLSSFKPIKVLKGTFKTGKLAATPRKVLVVFQFVISIVLAIGTIIVFYQIQFTKDRPMGYDNSNLLMIGMNNPDYEGKYNLLRTQLKKTGAVLEMAESSSPLDGIYSNGGGFNWPGKAPDKDSNFGLISVTHDYGNTVGWQFIDGADFSRNLASDSTGVIINEAAVKYMSLENPVGTYLTSGSGRKRKIIGVTKNMITQSPFEPIKQSIYFLGYDRLNYINIKLNPTVSANAAISEIETVFANIVPSANFDYRFADEVYNRKFRAEKRLGNLAGVFTFLAIFISCLGLFGLASFIAEQRTKEIGVRKVLGASVAKLWQMLSKDFVGLVLISCAVAVPIAYYVMGRWLENYTYRMEMSWWVFGLTILGALAVTLLTVSYQAIKAASANPVKSLRTE